MDGVHFLLNGRKQFVTVIVENAFLGFSSLGLTEGGVYLFKSRERERLSNRGGGGGFSVLSGWGGLRIIVKGFMRRKGSAHVDPGLSSTRVVLG